MSTILFITIICLLLLVLWHKYKQSLDPKYLQERYHFAVHEATRKAELDEAIKKATAIYDSKRFTKKRMYPEVPKLDTTIS